MGTVPELTSRYLSGRSATSSTAAGGLADQPLPLEDDLGPGEPRSRARREAAVAPVAFGDVQRPHFRIEALRQKVEHLLTELAMRLLALQPREQAVLRGLEPVLVLNHEPALDEGAPDQGPSPISRRRRRSDDR